jgi:hypothetical protein
MLFAWFSISILIRFNPNYSTCFHNILQNKSCKNVVKTYATSLIRTIKQEKPSIHGYMCCGLYQCEYTHINYEKHNKHGMRNMLLYVGA